MKRKIKRMKNNARQGAWLAVGESTEVSLIAKLYQEGVKGNLPWFHHAAYRAIDNILINIETLGGKPGLNQLEDLLKELKENEKDKIHPGIKTRMEWTIECLKE